jgi:hypothetical protein
MVDALLSKFNIVEHLGYTEVGDSYLAERKIDGVRYLVLLRKYRKNVF